MSKPSLSLGPVPYFWSRDDLVNFYEQAADWPVDIVYLGETVCSKRRSFRFEDWINTARMLRDAGKEVVLSTLCLLEAESELKYLRRLCDNGEFEVEANDMGAVKLLRGRPFVCGPTVNMYNQHTLAVLARHGLRRWVMPVELSRETLGDLQASRPQGVQTEVLAFGRLPLTLSARCFTARADNLAKDDCGFRCIDDPEGRLAMTQEDEPFLVLNGIQTLSAQPQNLVGEIDTLQELGVEVLRIVPQPEGTGTILDIFAQALAGTLSAGEAETRLQAFAPHGTCDGYWHGRPGRQSAGFSAG